MRVQPELPLSRTRTHSEHNSHRREGDARRKKRSPRRRPAHERRDGPHQRAHPRVHHTHLLHRRVHRRVQRDVARAQRCSAPITTPRHIPQPNLFVPLSSVPNSLTLSTRARLGNSGREMTYATDRVGAWDRRSMRDDPRRAAKTTENVALFRGWDTRRRSESSGEPAGRGRAATLR